MQQLLFECVQNWWWSQTHTFSLFISLLLHAFNIPFPGDEVLMVKVCHPESCSNTKIPDFAILLNFLHCSHSFIQSKLSSHWCLPVKYLNFWPWHLCFIIFLCLCLILIITYKYTHLIYDTYLHPHSFLSVSILVSDSCRCVGDLISIVLQAPGFLQFIHTTRNWVELFQANASDVTSVHGYFEFSFGTISVVKHQFFTFGSA